MSEINSAPSFETSDYLGPLREIDPVVVAYVNDREALTSDDQEQALRIARNESQMDSAQNTVIVQSGGENYWASEYPNVFTFDDSLRGSSELFPADEAKRSASEVITGPGGQSTHAIIETDDGHIFVFRRTNDRKSAARQAFELSSTTMHLGQGEDDTLLRRPIDTEQLRGVVVRPGLPLKLNNDPQSGKSLQTRGNVVRITTVQRTDEGKVAENHPHLNRPDKQRDAPSRFLEAINFARTMEAASKIGPLMVKSS